MLAAFFYSGEKTDDENHSYNWEKEKAFGRRSLISSIRQTVLISRKGMIAAENRDYGGCEFTVTLPVNE